MTIVNNNGSNIRTTVSLTNVIRRMALLRFTPRVGTSRILRSGLHDLGGISVVLGTRAARIGNSNDGIINLRCQSHIDNSVRGVRLTNVFIRVNLLPGAG